MDGYGEHCPIALGAEVFAERWTPIILRNLLIGCQRFGEILDGAPGLPRSVLAQRLRRLERDGVVERVGDGRAVRYRLTDCGRELGDVVHALGVWGARWREVLPEHYDPYLMLWTLSRTIPTDALPRPRVVVRFDIADAAPGRYWVVASRRGSELCVTDPRFAEDGVLATDSQWLYSWQYGHISLGRAQRTGVIAVQAPRWLHRTLAEWGRLSPFRAVRQPAGAR